MQDKEVRGWADTFRSFAKRHDKALTVIGAIIVFLTFVFKDAVRDELKDLTDSINNSQQRFVTDKNAITSAQQTETIVTVIVEISRQNHWDASVEKGRNVEPYSSASAQELQGQEELIQSSKRLLQKIDPLLSHVDRPEDLIARRNVINSKLSGYQAKVDRLNKWSDPESERNKQFDDVVVKLANSLNEIDLIQEDAYQAAETKRMHLDKEYLYCTWVSYFTYIAGWALALVGKLFGVDALPSPE